MKTIYTNCILFCVLVILLALVYLTYAKDTNHQIEKYVSSDPSSTDYDRVSNIVYNFMRENGFESTNKLRDFINGVYNEDLRDVLFDGTLTLYYSNFSKDSIPEEDKTWRNISPYIPKDRMHTLNCQHLAYDKSHLEFVEIPYSNRNTGIELLTNKITGPPSHLLGLQGRGTFSVFIVLKFNGFSTNNTVEYDIFRLFGNNVSNNGISLVIESLPKSKDSKYVNMVLKVVYGAQNPIHIKYKDGDTFPFELTKTYMFVLSKTNKSVSLTVHDVTKSATQESVYRLIDNVELENPNLHLSNKEMVINSSGNLNAYIHAFGVYNMFIMEESALHQHMHLELQKASESFFKEARQILAFQNELDLIASCPYDENVCKECSDVKDWTVIENILKASPDCRTAIDKYCMQNTGNPKCFCWNPQNSNTTECKSYINIFKSDLELINPDSIEPSVIQRIKSKHNLCNCEDVDELKQQLIQTQERLSDEIAKQKSVYGNDYPVAHKLTSPHLIAHQNPDQQKMDALNGHTSNRTSCHSQPKTLLDNVPDGYLPPVSNQDFDQIANARKTYEGTAHDAYYFNKRVSDEYPGETIAQRKIMDSSDYTYGDLELRKPQSFWSWLFNRS